MMKRLASAEDAEALLARLASEEDAGPCKRLASEEDAEALLKRLAPGVPSLEPRTQKGAVSPRKGRALPTILPEAV